MDTAGISGWAARNNSDTSWSFGAFDRYLNTADPFDVGWGIYNTTTHNITGDSVYFYKSAAGNWKKIWIKEHRDGKYWFRYADLDGSNQVDTFLTKADFTDKIRGYYSMTSHSILDREPASDTWDIVFTQYNAWLGVLYYPVTGVLHNSGLEAIKAYPIADAATSTDYASGTWSHLINAIGYDWKGYDMSTGYYVEDSLCYFIKDLDGNIFRIVFTGFDGTTTGKIYFDIEQIHTSSLSNIVGSELYMELYPNPASGSTTLIYNAATNGTINILGLDGRIIQTVDSREGLNRTVLDLTGINTGIYLIQLNNEEGSIIKKLAVQ